MVYTRYHTDFNGKFSEYIGAYTAEVLGQVIQIAVLLGSAYIVKALLRFCQSYLSHVASWNVVAQLRTEVYAHLQKLSLSYYSDKQTGQLMSRVMNDTALLEQMVAHSTRMLLPISLFWLGLLFY